MADIPSFITLLLPTHVTGYTNLCPKYAASSCTNCAAYPNAVATLSSDTSFRDGNDRGGAGSVGPVGIGSGTSRIVKRRSGGESSSIGKMNAREVRSSFRMGASWLRSNIKSVLEIKCQKDVESLSKDVRVVGCGYLASSTCIFCSASSRMSSE